MFERYTEKARRVIFFARYEASQFGSPYIESEHMLLGLLREDKALTNRILKSHASIESIRVQIEASTTIRKKTSTSVDLPLSNECKRILAYAAEEAHRLKHEHIGTEHLLLGTLREEKCFAAIILAERGVKLESMREELAITPHVPATAAEAGPGKLRGSLQRLIERLIDLDDKTIQRLQSLLDQIEEKDRENATEEVVTEIDTSAVAPNPQPAQRIDLYKVQSPTPLTTKLLRVLWHCFQLPFFEHTPRMLSPLRVFLLRLFGAEIGPACQIDCGVKIWIPWNLKMGARSCLGFNTEVYNFAPVVIGNHVVISQRSYLCTSTHDASHPHFPLVSAPIAVASQAWVAAGVFLSPGVTIGEGAVIGACSVVTKSMPAWTICAGNPCRPIKPRVVKPVD